MRAANLVKWAPMIVWPLVALCPCWVSFKQSHCTPKSYLNECNVVTNGKT